MRVLTVRWDVLGINLADMKEGGICLHVEVLGAEKFSDW